MNRKPIEIDFSIEEVNEIAEREAYAKEKYRPIYFIHKWWARRLGSVFRTIVLYSLLDKDAKVLENDAWRPVTKDELENPWKLYLKDVDLGGKVVLDPMMGGGTTVIEALRLGCKVVAEDLNPVAWFLMKKQVEVVDIDECVRILKEEGSICWEIGNYVDNGEIIPLDILLYDCFKSNGLKLRNRIVWQFGHGLHCSNRFSGRYETILWFTKSDSYTFNLDAVRIPQKYPGKKHFKGPNIGKYSSNPKGKNPSDVWDIPNVKSNHVEKTCHPCQFPIALVQRLVLALSNEHDILFDPFLGVGSTAVGRII